MKNTSRRDLNKKIFWNLVEPKCTICGYDKNISCLEFHHINKNQKLNTLDSLSYWINLNTIKMLFKISTTDFTILCRNCHREIHLKGNDINIIPTNINIDINEFTKNSTIKKYISLMIDLSKERNELIKFMDYITFEDIRFDDCCEQLDSIEFDLGCLENKLENTLNLERPPC